MSQQSDFKDENTAPAHHSLRERAASFGLESLADVETLELFLSRTARQGARTWAEVLLARWGSLPRVLAAEVSDLAEVLGRDLAVDLKLLHETTLRLALAKVVHRDVISSWTALEAYVRLRLAGRGREEVRVIFLDKRNRLIADERMGVGTVDNAPIYPREVVRRALQLDASHIVLVHNHPAGDPSPSRADIEVTRQIVEAARALGIGVHDHLLVAGDGVASFKSLGLM